MSDSSEGPFDPAFVQCLLEDPSASFWLKQAIADLAERDPVDAYRDAELLLAVAQTRYHQVQQASKAILVGDDL